MKKKSVLKKGFLQDFSVYPTHTDHYTYSKHSINICWMTDDEKNIACTDKSVVPFLFFNVSNKTNSRQRCKRGDDWFYWVLRGRGHICWSQFWFSERETGTGYMMEQVQRLNSRGTGEYNTFGQGMRTDRSRGQLKRRLLANKRTETKNLEILWSDNLLISQKGKLRLPELRWWGKCQDEMQVKIVPFQTVG